MYKLKFLLLLISILLFANIENTQAAQAPLLPSDINGVATAGTNPSFTGGAASYWRVDYWDIDGLGTGFDPDAQITTSPTPLAGFGTESLEMIPGDGAGGAGCARLGGKSFFGTQNLNGLRLGDLDQLSYSFLVNASPNSGGATDSHVVIYVNLFVDLNGDGVWNGATDSILIFEPIYTGTPPFAHDTWFTFDIIGPGATGRWHYAAQPLPAGTIGQFTPSAVDDLWTEIVAAGGNADLRLVNPPGTGCGVHGPEGTESSLVFVIGQKDGAAYNGMITYLDNITVETSPVGDPPAAYSNTAANMTIAETTLDFETNPYELAFVQQPTDALAGSAIAPAITVQVQNAAGETITTATDSITLAIGTNPGAGTLSGTATNAAVSGVATFAGMSINNAGIGYTLTASATGFTPVSSNPFNITALPTSQVIVVSPANAQGWLFDNPVYCTPATQPAVAPFDPCSITGGGTPINGQFELGTDTEAGLGFENGPDTPPLGTGSYFAEIYDGGSKVVAARNDYNNALLADLFAMSISTYLDPAATDNSNWYINLYADANGDGTYDCRLDGSVPAQAAGSWQTTDLMALTWNITCGANGTIASFVATNPNAQLINGFNEAGFPQIVINQGDTQINYEGYMGNFDAFRIAHATVGDITWDFELEEPVIPVDPTPEPGDTGSGSTSFDPVITELPATGQTPWWAQMAQGLFLSGK